MNIGLKTWNLMNSMKEVIGDAPIMKASKKLQSKGCTLLKSIRWLHKMTVNQAKRTNQMMLTRLTTPTQKNNKKMRES